MRCVYFHSWSSTQWVQISYMFVCIYMCMCICAYTYKLDWTFLPSHALSCFYRHLSVGICRAFCVSVSASVRYRLGNNATWLICGCVTCDRGRGEDAFTSRCRWTTWLICNRSGASAVGRYWVQPSGWQEVHGVAWKWYLPFTCRCNYNNYSQNGRPHCGFVVRFADASCRLAADNILFVVLAWGKGATEIPPTYLHLHYSVWSGVM